MISAIISSNAQKASPDKNFLSCLCCIPKAWILFVNDQWVRAFESHDEGLTLLKEFRYDDITLPHEPIFFIERISLWLDESVWNNNFDHLILVAPSPILAIFNITLSPYVMARTIAEIDWPTATISLCESKMQNK